MMSFKDLQSARICPEWLKLMLVMDQGKTISLGLFDGVVMETLSEKVCFKYLLVGKHSIA